MAKEIELCDTCGAKMMAYWVPLKPGLVRALVKFRRAVAHHGRNSIHLLKDMSGTPFELTRHEWNNFSRLRFHGMAVKASELGKAKSGYWLLTKKGNAFLNGEITVPARVKIFRNRIIERSDEEVNIAGVMGETPYFEKIDDIEYEHI